MPTCFRCGDSTWSFYATNMYRVLNTSVQDKALSKTTTTTYETTAMRVPFCDACRKKMDRYTSLSILSYFISIGFITYLWHLYFPNLSEVEGFWLQFGAIIVYLLIIGTLISIFDKIIRSITGHKKDPEYRQEILNMKSDGWKIGLRP